MRLQSDIPAINPASRQLLVYRQSQPALSPAAFYFIPRNDHIASLPDTYMGLLQISSVPDRGTNGLPVIDSNITGFYASPSQSRQSVSIKLIGTNT